ncbi:MAG: hypothetical protein WC365_00050 [Candidatus Babeliales bacterium]|jgi:ankyrin repeat protein
MKISSSIACIGIFIAVSSVASTKLLANLDDELQEAIMHQDTHAVIQLLNAGASPDATESEFMKSEGLSPLMVSLFVVRPDFVRMLLVAGANPYLKYRGATTLGLARIYLHETQNKPSIFERIIPCYRKKRIRNLQNIITHITEKIAAIELTAKQVCGNPECDIIPTTDSQKALEFAKAICRTNLVLQLKRINNSYQHQEEEIKEPGEAGEK